MIPSFGNSDETLMSFLRLLPIQTDRKKIPNPTLLLLPEEARLRGERLETFRVTGEGQQEEGNGFIPAD